MTDYSPADTAAQLLGAAALALRPDVTTIEGDVETDDPAVRRIVDVTLDVNVASAAANFDAVRRIVDDGEDLAAVAVRLAIAAAAAIDVAARASGRDPDAVRRQVLAVAELWANLPGDG